MYQALYRKYRPKSFFDVYGQDHITSTLKNEIKENRISHAYLFTGSRGTGKTTCAKILAKAVNCENPQNGEPCNECEACRGLDSGAIYDVVEIDAASNNGVDNIRDLRQEVNYAPSRCKYRVYIIDEVHMLTQGAYNALLKTLEEPPSHVIFILATTEVHKIPATILSRCQRFDFKRIQPETMAVRLKQVAELEGMTLNDDAAVLIARIADGALRDGLSILDQCAGRGSVIDSELVSRAAGLAGREMLHSLAEYIQKKDSSSAIDAISQLYQNSYDMERLCVELINHFRNYLIVKTVKKSRELIICTDDEYDLTLSGAKGFTLENIIFCLDLFQTTLTKIKSGANARIEMEMTFIKLCEPRLEQSNEALLERISQLELMIKRNAYANTSQPAPADTSKQISEEKQKQSELPKQTEEVQQETVQKPVVQQTEHTSEPSPVQEAKPSPEPQTPVSNETRPFEHWAEFLDLIYKNDIVLYGVLYDSSASVSGDYFIINSANPTIKDFIKVKSHSNAIKQAVFELTGRHFKLAVPKRKDSGAPKKDLLEDLINQAQNNVTINFE